MDREHQLRAAIWTKWQSRRPDLRYSPRPLRRHMTIRSSVQEVGERLGHGAQDVLEALLETSPTASTSRTRMAVSALVELRELANGIHRSILINRGPAQRGLEDRVAALNGTLDLSSPAGAGTRSESPDPARQHG